MTDWVSMTLSYDSVHTNGGKRKDKFVSDMSIDEAYQVNESVYKQSGYTLEEGTGFLYARYVPIVKLKKGWRGM